MHREHQHLTSLQVVNVNSPAGLALAHQVKKERRGIILVIKFLNFSCLQDRMGKKRPLQLGKGCSSMTLPVIPVKVIVAAVAVTGEYMTQALLLTGLHLLFTSVLRWKMTITY